MSLTKKSKVVKVVKAAYSSPLREAQAKATRTMIIDAAAVLFAEKGYAPVSVDMIAAAAGVSRATVFTSIGGKPSLLKEAYGAAFARASGAEGEAMPFVERPRSREVRALKNVHEYLAGYSALATKLDHHLARLHEALREAARADADAQTYLEEAYAIRRRGAGTIVADVRARAPLREGLDEEHAADAVWAIMDPSWFYLLVHLRGWPEARFAEWLARTLEEQLLGKPVSIAKPSATAKKTPKR